MFNRLVANLPFNPSLLNQVAFYSKRLRQESSVRRLGFLFIALTFLVQMFAIFAPAEPSLAYSGNDIMPGGFTSQADGVNKCNTNQAQFATILAHWGVSCQDLAGGRVRRIDYNENGGRLRSIGRYPYGFAGEQPHDVPGVGRIFSRPLTAWGAHCYNDGKGCQAIVGNSGRGMFMVLFSCGNLVFLPTVAPPPAPKEIFCSNLTMNILPGSRVKKGSSVVVSGKAGGRNLPAGELADFWYDYANAATGTAVIPQQLGAQGVGFNNGVATDPNQHTFKLDQPGHYVFRLFVKYGGSSKEAAGNAGGGCAADVYVEQPPVDVCPNKPGLQTSSQECDVCPLIPGTQQTAEECKPCTKSASDNDVTACVVLTKAASNITQKIPNADGTTAKAGDTITYTLAAQNTAKTDLPKFVVEEHIGDILEYADVTDYHGGSKDANNIVRWPATALKAGGQIQQLLTVKIKDPLPQTPASASNPGSFDMKMTNVYGKTVTINLPPSLPKATEQVTTALPNTGPGSNMLIAFVLVTVAGYFFARSRLLAKELDIIRTEYATGV